MDKEDKNLLRENLKLNRENNRLLKKMRRGMLFSSFFRLLYWLIIIGASLGTYYYLQPYIDEAKNTYNQIKGGVDTVSEGVTNTTKNTGEAVNSVLDFGKNIIGL